MLGFSEKASAQYQTVYRTRKEELFRIDAIATLEAHSHVVVVAALLRQPVVAGAAIRAAAEGCARERVLRGDELRAGGVRAAPRAAQARGRARVPRDASTRACVWRA